MADGLLIELVKNGIDEETAKKIEKKYLDEMNQDHLNDFFWVMETLKISLLKYMISGIVISGIINFLMLLWFFE